jgi:hypothetical protein
VDLGRSTQDLFEISFGGADGLDVKFSSRRENLPVFILKAANRPPLLCPHPFVSRNLPATLFSAAKVNG